MISLCIPIYNAQDLILNNYRVLKKQLEDLALYDYELLFEDDASTDKSRDILEGLAALDHRIKVSSHYPNRGLGFTLRNLFRRAKGRIIIYLDIDLPYGIDCLSVLLRELDNADVILASRYSSIKNKIPIERAITSNLYYLFCKLLFGISVRDLGSGFVVLKRNVIETISLSCNGFDIHIELFSQIKKSGFAVREIPLKYAHNSNSTFSILKHSPGIVFSTLKLWLRNR